MASYRDLKVWQAGVNLAIEVYRLSSAYTKSELYGMTSQVRRAAVSVASNIAEGHARKAQKDFHRFLNIAKGSLAELETQLIIASELGFVEKGQIEHILSKTDQLSRMISGLIRTLQESP